MDEKKNLTLIDRMTGFFSKTAKSVRRGETTETGREAGVVSYYYKKIQLERTRIAKYGDYVLMDEEYPESLMSKGWQKRTRKRMSKA